ncbi:MAG TPA: gamma-glutamyltransferase [Myxococcota bacterium]
MCDSLRRVRIRSRFRLIQLVLAVSLLAPRVAQPAWPAPALARGGMVVASQSDATRAGVEMLEAGGNAVDAAVATAFALCVSQPFSTGIGGGAFLLIRLASGEVIALDARETAPAAADREMYVRPGVPERASMLGPLAVATPGLVAGLALALERWGTLPLARVLQPAIRLAEQGFAIGPYHARMLEALRASGLAARLGETARIQFPPPGTRAEPGWRLRQPDLARTLKLLAAQGPDAFYRGEIGAAIAEHLARSGGLVTRADLAGYAPKLRPALRGRYRGLEVISFPPPSSGGVVLLQALGILEGFDLGSLGAGSSASLHRIAEAMKLAFADRAALLGDPDFVAVPAERLISANYVAAQRARINPPWWRRAPWTWHRREVAIRVPGPGFTVDDAGTTHLSVADAAGNAVAITETINTPFGSGITVPGTGIVLNNEMDDFSIAPNRPNAYGLVDTRGANAIEPGKRPLSSMTPSIVLRGDKLLLVTGSPGGPRIISTVLLSILNVVDYELDVMAAVSAPRIHHQWQPDTLVAERAIAEDVLAGLRERGHQVEVSRDNWSSAQALVYQADTGWYGGGSDPRSDGLALGPRLKE